jgi:hypothetical protein
MRASTRTQSVHAAASVPADTTGNDAGKRVPSRKRCLAVLGLVVAVVVLAASAAFADLRRPLRARDLCTALDLPIVAKNTEGIRSRLKRLASRGILVETEPGLFTQTQPLPDPCYQPIYPAAAYMYICRRHM